MANVKISELPSITSANLISSGLSIVPIVANITGANVSYQTTVANIKTFVSTGDLSLTGNLTAVGLTTNNSATARGGIQNTPIGNATANTGAFTTITTTSTATVASLTSNANITLSGNIIDTGAIAIQTGSNGNIALEPDGTGVIVFAKDATGTSATFTTKLTTSNLATGAINANGAVTVSSLISNGAVSGTTGTFTTSTTTSALNTGTLNANSTATVNALASNGAVSGTTGTFTTSTTTSTLNTGTLNANGTATVNALASNGAVSGTTGTFTTKVTTSNLATGAVNANGAVTVSSLISNGSVSGTTGTFTTSTTTSALNTGTLNANSTATVNALTSNGAVSGTTGTFTTSTTTSALNTGTLNANSTTTVASLTSNANITLSGNIIDTGALAIQTGSNGNINLEPNGTGVIVVTKDIRNGQANATGNIGSSTNYFNTVFAKATSAQYADLAEIYQSDNLYNPGTVVIFGGLSEVTVSDKESDTRVAGAISTDPAYLMNAKSNGVVVALRGKIPVNLIGAVTKGDLLVTSKTAGYAISVKNLTSYDANAVFAKSLETDDNTTARTIWAVIL